MILLQLMVDHHLFKAKLVVPHLRLKLTRARGYSSGIIRKIKDGPLYPVTNQQAWIDHHQASITIKDFEVFTIST